MKITLYRNSKDNDSKVVDMTWEEFVTALAEHQETPCAPCAGKACPHKDTTAFIPGWVDGKRGAKNVKELNALCLDFDGISLEAARAVFAAIEPYEALVYSSHSYRADFAAFRVVIPLLTPVPASQWPAFWAGAVKLLGDLPTDGACKDASRIYYKPTHAPGAPHFSRRKRGSPLDPTLVPIVAHKPTQEVDLAQLAKVTLKGTKGQSKKTLLAISEGQPLGFSAAQRAGNPELPGRDAGLNAAASVLVFNSPRGTPVAALFEMMRKSLGAMDLEPEGLAHWEAELTDMLERAVERRATEDARRVAEFARQGSHLGLQVAGIPTSGETPGAAVPNDPEPISTPSPEGVPALSEFLSELLIRDTADGPKLINDPGNAKLILLSAPEWKNAIRFNRLSGFVEMNGGPLNLHGELKDVYVLHIRDWLARNPQRNFRLTLSTAATFEVVTQVAEANSFDPLEEYFKTLKWDGQRRLSGWLQRYMGATTLNFTGQDITRYNEAVGRKWMISAVARALAPGCKAEAVLVFESKQNSGKSTAAQILAGGPKYFTDTALDFASKDAAQITTTTWIIELAELESLRKSESTQAKAFFSKQEEKYRAPYARSTTRHPRRCVFIGSTNHSEYLNDPTGNRRYWPVKVGDIDLDALRADRDQLWAEAHEAYRAGEQWWLGPEEYALAFAEAEERVATDDWAAPALDYWKRQGCPEMVTTHGLLTQGLNVSVDKLNRASQMRAGHTLRALGFERKRMRVDGVLMWVYAPTPEMLASYKGVDVTGPMGVAPGASMVL